MGTPRPLNFLPSSIPTCPACPGHARERSRRILYPPSPNSSPCRLPNSVFGLSPVSYILLVLTEAEGSANSRVSPAALSPCPTISQSPLARAFTGKQRVLAGFSRTGPRSSSLDATLTRIPVSVDYKELTGKLNPLHATLTKNRRWGPPRT
jgi:hypothetical protein